ncbi:hypothetical protein C8R42DRAFT_738871 [Lentinula raphanica]|nr:hypothetical protein C8R42DRAFT_738871 [Lentinula raphanica]
MPLRTTNLLRTCNWLPEGPISVTQNLCVNISDPNSHRFASFWVTGCIGVHSFAMQCKAEEWEHDEDWDFAEDPFVVQGLLPSEESDDDINIFMLQRGEQNSQIRLRAARKKHVYFKNKLLCWREHKKQYRSS